MNLTDAICTGRLGPQNEVLLCELESLAKNAGDDGATDRYAQIRQQAAAARATLEGGAPINPDRRPPLRTRLSRR